MDEAHLPALHHLEKWSRPVGAASRQAGFPPDGPRLTAGPRHPACGVPPLSFTQSYPLVEMAMLDRFLCLSFNLANADVFQSVRTSDPLLNEKRVRERRMLAATLGSMAFMFLSMFVTPGPGAEGRPWMLGINEVARMLAAGLDVAALVCLAWLVFESIG